MVTIFQPARPPRWAGEPGDSTEGTAGRRTVRVGETAAQVGLGDARPRLGEERGARGVKTSHNHLHLYPARPGPGWRDAYPGLAPAMVNRPIDWGLIADEYEPS